MQSSKDSFFVALRERLATVNPERKVVIDGQLRPGILVCENEGPGLDERVADVFCVTFGEVKPPMIAGQGPMVIVSTISYRTKGSTESGEVGRGRALSAMDEELKSILSVGSTPKMDYSKTPATDLGTNVFWGAAQWGAVTLEGEFAVRSVTVKVYSHEEAQG